MKEQKPNIIWFVVDQMRGQALGINGDPNVFTPNLDNMAIPGTNFTNALSGCPLCCPFRGSMLTGKYPHNNSVRRHEERLDPSFRTVTDVFNENDYETICFGKWHLAGLKGRGKRTALQTVSHDDRGRFDTWVGYENNNSQYECFLHGHDGDEELPHHRLPGYETDCLTDLALEKITGRKNSDRPFFMVVSVQPPHYPNIAPARNRRYQAQQLTLRPNVPESCAGEARIALSGYYAQIKNIDENVGRLIGGLRKANLLDNTHIMFFSDHGDQLQSHGRFGKCVPLEESVRVPFVIGGGFPLHYDGRQFGNVPCLINHVDIAPTTLGLCGLGVPEWMEGFDYSHRRTGRNFKKRVEQEPDSAFLQMIDQRESSYPWRGVVTRDGWKYACVENGEWLLFDLNADPFEQNNLAFNAYHRQKRSNMKALLQDWIEKTGDDFALPGG